MTDSPYPPQQTQPTRPGWLMPVLITVAVIVVAAGGITAWALTRTTPATATAAAAPTTAAPTPAHVAPVVASGPSPSPGDFLLAVKVTRKQCFGSAGCNVEYHIEVAYTGQPLSATETWLVTYEVKGVDDGPAVNSFEITGESYSYDKTELGQTPSTKTKLAAKVTSVERG